MSEREKRERERSQVEIKRGYTITPSGQVVMHMEKLVSSGRLQKLQDRAKAVVKRDLQRQRQERD